MSVEGAIKVSVPFLLITAILTWEAVMLIPGPYKYKVGDCIGVNRMPIAQIADRREGAYTLDPEVWFKEGGRDFISWGKDEAEDATDLVKCPERKWRKK